MDDVTAPTIAYRAWKVRPNGYLYSMAMPLTWIPGDMHAGCQGSLTRYVSPHDAPHDGCNCGFYVMHTLNELLDEPTQVARLPRMRVLGAVQPPVVAGEVEVWGRSERYEHGRRVEWCRVHALYAEPLAGEVDVGAVAERYGVPLVEDDGRIAAWKEREPESEFNPGGILPPTTSHIAPASVRFDKIAPMPVTTGLPPGFMKALILSTFEPAPPKPLWRRVFTHPADWGELMGILFACIGSVINALAIVWVGTVVANTVTGHEYGPGILAVTGVLAVAVVTLWVWLIRDAVEHW